MNFDPIRQWPKPVQRPHPPVLVGGEGPNVLRRVVDYGDAWMPNARGGAPALADRIVELQSLARGAGRELIRVTVWSPQRDPRLLEDLQEMGVERCVFGLAAAPAGDVLPRLAHYADVVRPFV